MTLAIRYNLAMTAKQALIERVEEMTEEEAAELLAQLEWDSTEFEVLTPEDAARVEEGFAQIRAGDSIDGAELFRQLGL